MKAAKEGDIDTLVSMSHSGIDVTTARSSDRVSMSYQCPHVYTVQYINYHTC